MPFVFVHGVAVRDDKTFPSIRDLLRKYVAPMVSSNPSDMPFYYAFWGDAAAHFRWDGASMPRGPFTMGVQGGVVPTPLAGIEDTFNAHPPSHARPQEQGPRPMGPVSGVLVNSYVPTSAVVTVATASDILSIVIKERLDRLAISGVDSRAQYGVIIGHVDDVLHEYRGDGMIALDEPTMDVVLIEAMKRSTTSSAMGFGDVWADIRNRVVSIGQRAQDQVGGAVADALAGMRQPINHFTTMFTGDVFAYLNSRDRADGSPVVIPERVIAAFSQARDASRQRNNEPIVVLSHSMGGQLVYDFLTSYVNAAFPSEFMVDFWAAAASQVGLFEELSLLKSPDPGSSKKLGVRASYPNRVKHWLNVWDPNDWLSYTVKDIFEGVDDRRFMSNANLAEAHGAYLILPRFYQMVANAVKDSRVKLAR